MKKVGGGHGPKTGRSAIEEEDWNRDTDGRPATAEQGEIREVFMFSRRRI
jgi:hypothetical protein